MSLSTTASSRLSSACSMHVVRQQRKLCRWLADMSAVWRGCQSHDKACSADHAGISATGVSKSEMYIKLTVILSCITYALCSLCYRMNISWSCLHCAQKRGQLLDSKSCSRVFVWSFHKLFCFTTSYYTFFSISSAWNVSPNNKQRQSCNENKKPNSITLAGSNQLRTS